MPARKGKPKKTGRPSKFTQAIADEICKRLSLGESLRAICSGDEMPDKATVMRWLASEDHLSFRDHYARAREAQADHLFEEILEIADDGRNDTYQNADGAEVVNHDHIQRSRLRVDSRKWMAGKLAPKKYGDKVQQEVSGPNGGPIPIQRVERVIVEPSVNAKD